jgi:NADH-quinone oxidoreductase subunit L
MLVPLVILAGLSVFGGFMNWPFEGGHKFGHWLEATLESSMGHVEAAPEFNLTVALSATGLAFIAIFISWLIYGRKPLKSGEKDPLAKAFGPVFKLMHNKWYIDEIYDFLILTPYQKLAGFLAQTLDEKIWHDWFHEKGIRDNFQRLTKFLANPIDLGIIDGISKFLAKFAERSAGMLSKMQTGFVRNYTLSVLFGVVVIIGYLIFK